MAYFVTGATGFIGRYLVERLLARGERVYVLVRPQSMPKFEALRAWWGPHATRVVPIAGDLAERDLGVSKSDLRKLTGKRCKVNCAANVSTILPHHLRR